MYDHDRPDRWTEATAPWVNGYWRYLWANKYLPVTAIDTAANVFTITDRPGYRIATGRFWYGLNLLEEIDRPGEWYLERDPEAPGGTFGRLYLWPPEKLNTAEIMLSLHGGDGAALVRLDSVSRVRFEGLTFELTRGDGIVIEGSRDVVIDRCVLRNIGGQGIATGGCTRIGVLDSELSGIGSEGVRLSGGDRRTLTPGRNYVRNCRIRDFGRWKRTYSQAVRFHEGVGNEATHNLIHGTPHIAIQYSGNEHLIRYNEIFDSCRETGDAGVIMGDWGWDSRGNLIADNYLHDNVSRVPGRGSFNAVYLDGSCAGDTISGNIFYDSGEFGVMHNSGREVVIDNNIFVGGKAAIHATVHAWYDTTEGHAMNFLERIQAFDYRKPPWSLAYPALAATPDDRGHPDFERFKLPVGSLLVRNLSWRSRYWLDPRRLEAYDHYERIAGNIDGEDPRFLDEAGRRLALRGDSPAWEIPGFRRIPFEKMGRLKRSKASRPHPPEGYDYPLPAGGQVVLRWAPALDGAARDLYLGENPGGLEEKPAASRLESHEFVAANLEPGKRYFWRVDERGAGGAVLARGDVWSFTTGLDSAPAGAAAWRFDTDRLTADLGGQLVQGDFEGGVAVYGFDDLEIPPGVTVSATGLRPLELRSARDIAVRGTIDVSGEEGGDSLGGLARGGRGRLGGFDGGGAGATDSTGSAGKGPGAGGAGTSIFYAGGGGGFGGRGGDATIELEQTVKVGRTVTAGETAAGGAAYGQAGGEGTLSGGSGGAGGGGGTTSGAAGPGGAGGAGGGAVRLRAGGNILVTGSILADGGGGSGFRRTGGGGSGGMISLQAGGAVEIVEGALLGARGGKGGNCAWMGANGGGGGGGRIAIRAQRLTIRGIPHSPGPVAGAPELVVSGGPGGYYAVDAVNNAAKGESGTVFFRGIGR